MEVKVEAVSYTKYGVKINDVWYNAKQEAVKTALKTVSRDDTVEFSANEKELTFIKVVKKGAPVQQKQSDLTRVPEKVSKELDLDKLMCDSIDTVVAKALETVEEEEDLGRTSGDNKLKIPEKLGEQIEWGSIIISLFIGKVRQR